MVSFESRSLLMKRPLFLIIATVLLANFVGFVNFTHATPAHAEDRGSTLPSFTNEIVLEGKFITLETIYRQRLSFLQKKVEMYPVSLGFYIQTSSNGHVYFVDEPLENSDETY